MLVTGVIKSANAFNEKITMVRYNKSPSVIPIEKNIAEARPLEVEIESNARVPGPGVMAKIKRVKPKTKKIFSSIIEFCVALPKRYHIF